MHCLAVVGCFLLWRRMFCSVEEAVTLSQSRRVTVWVIAFPGFAKKEQLCVSKGPCPSPPYYMGLQEESHRITESQNVWGWKGPLWVI